jgi:hypothetical protein
MVEWAEFGEAADEVFCSRPAGPRRRGVFMSDLTFVEIDGQHVELLPARTVLSMFATGGSCVVEGGDAQSGFLSGLAGNAGVGAIVGLAHGGQGDPGGAEGGSAACWVDAGALGDHVIACALVG